MFKNLFNTKTIVATGLGAALFMVLFTYVKIPSPIPNTSFQIAFGISAFFGALFGPICGFLVAFIGHMFSDFMGGGLWWSWIIASGVSGLISGLAYFVLNIEKKPLTNAKILYFCLINLVGAFVAYLLVAPTLDILIYSEPANLVFAQGIGASAMNAIAACVVGGFLLIAYSKTKTTKGSLNKE